MPINNVIKFDNSTLYIINSLGMTFLKFRTKVECGGQCLLTPSCSAFRFDDNSCQLYDATYLYKDKTDNGMDVYMHDTLWNQRGNTRILSLVNVFFAVMP